MVVFEVKNALFGFTNDDLRRRGEFFLVWSLYDHATLVVLIAGEAAAAIEEEYPDAQVVTSCMATLRRIFGNEIEDPIESSVTRWGSDRWAQGSYSSVAPGSTGENYDQMAQPLYDPKNPR